MTQALYRKWRSQTFDEVVGQEHVTQTLRNALRDDRVAHAYLFSGPRGTGKTSTARILAKALNCTASEGDRPCNACPTCTAITEGRMLDLIEIDAASNNSVDDIRELRDKVGFRPSEGRFKVYIIDEVHMLSTSAFNALLKTLEEPPPHARFVLATTEPHKIPATVLSRCQRFDFRRIPVNEIAGHLQNIVDAEGFQADADALTAIGRSAQGCMRDAVSLLDQMLSYGAEKVTLAQVQQVLGAVNLAAVVGFVDALAAKNIAAGLTLLQQLLYTGASLNEFCHQVIEHLRGVLVLQMTDDAGLLNELPTETVQQMQAQAQKLAQNQTLFAIKRFSEAVQELKGGYQPQLPLEMALIESVQGVATFAVAPVVVEHGTPPSAAPTATPTTQKTTTAGPSANGQHAAPSAAAAPAEDALAAATATDAGEDEADVPQLDVAALQKLSGDGWKHFLTIVRNACGLQTQAALNTVRDIAAGENQVAFAFGNNQFTRGMIEKPDTLPLVTDLLSKYLGRPISLECQDGNEARLSGLKRIAPVETTPDGPDPLVDFAIAEWGAEVIE